MNQQPDSVPAMVKPGEYVLPADTVDAVGGQQALDGVVQATHTQAPNTAVVPQGFEPQYFFSQGGAVPDEEKRRLAQVPASMQRRENTTFEQPAAPAAPRPARDPGIASAAMALPQDNAPTFASMAAQGKSTPPMPVAAPLSAPTQPTPSEMGVAVPPSPDNIFPGNRLRGTSGFSGAPIRNSDLAPAAPPAPPVARNPAVTSAAMGLPQDNGPEMFSTPQMRASLSVPKPPAPPAPQPDAMAGMAATGFNPNITAKAERPPAGVPSAPPQSNAGVYMGNPNSATAEFVSEASADAGRRWDQGDVAGAIGAGLRTGVGAVSIGAVEALDNTVGAAARGFVSGGGRMLDGLLGSQAQATPAAPAAPAANAAKPATTSAPAAPGAAAAANPAAAPANTAASAPATTSAAAPAATGSTTGQSGEQLPTGVYQHGRGQYSDSAQGMGFSPGFTGRPNAQNLNAASNLSAQSMRDSASRVMAQPASQPQARGFRAPTVNTSANDFTTREALRRAKMDASSLIHSSSWAPKGSGQAAQARYNQMQQADLAAQAQQGTMDMQAMGFNAGMAREQLQQDGALQRTLIGQSSDAARLGLEERRLAGEETARGFQVRQGQRLEQAQDAYMKAKTPQEQASALATMRALSGKGEGSLKDNYMSLGGGQEWDAQAGTMRNVPQRLVDLRTGQEVGGNSRPVGPATPRTKAEYDALPKGAEYIRDGKTFIKS
ncbi:hypothetical protein [Comamonas jiangduensis]|uniref:hypothetical protein n=1 Tax=Comamonas jiangduensis TaxID=1194168 RepID=UPI003BF849D0